MKRWIILLVVFAVIIFTLPLCLQFFIFDNNFPSRVSNDGWANFFGGYIGASIGASATIIAVILEIKNNTKLRREDMLREYKPYLYMKYEGEDDKNIYVTIYNLGKYAACNIKGYIIAEDSQSLVWNQHYSIIGNEGEKIFIPYLDNEHEHHMYEFKDILGNTYQQNVRCEKEIYTFGYNFLSEEPILVKTK